MVSDLQLHFKSLNETANAIYDTLISKENPEIDGGEVKEVVTVSSLLDGLKSDTVDLLEEKCISLFYKEPGHGHGHGKKGNKAAQSSVTAQKVVIPKKKFRKWWTQAELSDNE
jgi:hypothetical protein